MELRRSTKNLLLLLLGFCVFGPFIFTSIVLQARTGLSVYGIVLRLSFSFPLALYCYFLYGRKREKHWTKYPIVPPEGWTDIYFPRTDIPRPIHEDARRFPEFFQRRKTKKTAERPEKQKRKK